jgi:hypothetical protein
MICACGHATCCGVTRGSLLDIVEGRASSDGASRAERMYGLIGAVEECGEQRECRER